MDQLELKKFISPFDGTMTAKVLITPEQFEEEFVSHLIRRARRKMKN